jgi:hypothetical protein
MTIVLFSDDVGSQGQGMDPDIRIQELGPAILVPSQRTGKAEWQVSVPSLIFVISKILRHTFIYGVVFDFQLLEIFNLTKSGKRSKKCRFTSR